MKTASIQDLHDRTEEVLSWVAGGESVQVHREGKALAVLHPLAPPLGPPDLAQRLQDRCGDKILPVSWAELIAADRGRF